MSCAVSTATARSARSAAVPALIVATGVRRPAGQFPQHRDLLLQRADRGPHRRLECLGQGRPVDGVQPP
jgi:hypothetical protein